MLAFGHSQLKQGYPFSAIFAEWGPPVPKFQPGDRVRCIDDGINRTWGLTGKVGVVRSIGWETSNATVYKITWPSRAGLHYGDITDHWHESYLDFAEDPFLKWARELVESKRA